MVPNSDVCGRPSPRGKRQNRKVTLIAALLLAASLLAPPAITGASVSTDGAHDSRFRDIDEAGSHASSIAALDRDDVFIGTECGVSQFCPDGALQRWVMAVWLVRVLGEDVNVGAGSDLFDDVDYNQWWAPFVDRLATLGITKGCATDPARFCPNDPVTRGQMASFLVRAYDLETAEPAGFTDTEDNTHARNIDSLAVSGITRGCTTHPLRFCPTADVSRGQMASFLFRARKPPTPQFRIAFGRNFGTRIFVMNADGTDPHQLTSKEGWDPTWSPDGTKIAYVGRSHIEKFHRPKFQPDGTASPGNPNMGSLWVMNADGTNQVRLAEVGRDPSWSPDSSRIAYTNGGQVLAIAADGENSQILKTNARNPSWSPDGSHIAYETTSAGIGVMEADGTNPLELEESAYNLSWSPDSALIAYLRNDEIWVVHPDGSNRRRVAPEWTSEITWSPDSATIAYANHEVAVVNIDGTGRRLLAPWRSGTDRPVWSPDGKRIAFLRLRHGGIWAMDADGTDWEQLTVENFGFDPDWSPDGSRIAYAGDLGWRVFSINADGTDERQLTSGNYDWHPVWSPDGTRIAFRHNTYLDGGISVVNSDGARQQRLTVGSHDYIPFWDPDSRGIAYGNRDGIWVINANGSGRSRILDGDFWGHGLAWSPTGTRIAYRGVGVMNADGTSPEHLTGDHYGGDPVWSPDGTRIAYENEGIWVMNADGTGHRQLSSDRGQSPAWSADSTRIAYDNRFRFPRGIRTMNADGTNPRQLTVDNGINPVWSADGTEIAYSRSYLAGGVFIVNADGSNRRRLTYGDDFDPTWSPVPIP